MSILKVELVYSCCAQNECTQSHQGGARQSPTSNVARKVAEADQGSQRRKEDNRRVDGPVHISIYDLGESCKA